MTYFYVLVLIPVYFFLICRKRVFCSRGGDRKKGKRFKVELNEVVMSIYLAVHFILSTKSL